MHRPSQQLVSGGKSAGLQPETIGAVVRKARYSDPRATEYMTQTLIARRDKVLLTWLNQVCPAVDPVLQTDGAFSFTNAAVATRAADPAESYHLQWFRFDNATAARTPVGEPQTVGDPAGRAPTDLRLRRVLRAWKSRPFTRNVRSGPGRQRSFSVAAAQVGPW